MPEGAGGVVIRKALVDGALRDCRIAAGRIAAVAPEIAPHPGDAVLEARGGALLPGLHDHHVHVLAAAAARSSLDLGGGPLPSPADAPSSATEGGPWLRVVGLGSDDTDRTAVDAVWPDRPVRVQHRSGALWVLNSAAVDELAGHLTPEERTSGRVWRERGQWGAAVAVLPLAADLRRLGEDLARSGVTGLTDATPDLDEDALQLIRDSLPQHLRTLGPHGAGLPRKVVIPDHADDAWEKLRSGVRAAREEGRPVALHAVSAVSLALAVAALDEVGVVPGDRVEHAAVCDDRMAEALAEREVVVVTQPTVAVRRGRTMLEESEPADRPWLWRLRGLVERGVAVVVSSDAPYGDVDPWSGIRVAATARPGPGTPWLDDQSLDPVAALRSYLTDPQAPAGLARGVVAGGPADLCLLDGPLEQVVARVVAGASPSPVRATFVGGVRVDGPDPQ